MIQCINRFFLPILLFYIGFILLGTLVGLAIGLLILAVWQAVLIGFFIGLDLAIIANGIALIIANIICFRNEHHFCD
jgi:hypothetical protein